MSPMFSLQEGVTPRLAFPSMPLNTALTQRDTAVNKQTPFRLEVVDDDA